MTFFSPHTWELEPENIEQVSAYIAKYKPLTKNSYYHSTCQDCYKKLPHAPHIRPCTLSENFTRLQIGQLAIEEIQAERQYYKYKRTNSVYSALHYFGQAETPFEEKRHKLAGKEEAVKFALIGLRDGYRAGYMSKREVLSRAKPFFASEDKIKKSMARIERDHEELKDDLDEWFERLEDSYDVKFERLERHMQYYIDALTEYQRLIDEDIQWYRDQHWQLAQ